jgi:small GTP-binding protein
VAKKASEGVGNRASQELLINLSQLLREAALRNLCKQAIALYAGTKIELPIPTLPQVKTQTLRDILTQAEPPEIVAQKPVNILIIGRTGAGKSSLINTLFQNELAAVDVLPSTDTIQNYHWETENGETLNLWDTPGYEQVKREDLRDLVIDYASNADLLLLVTPALDPALQMDVDFLQDLKLEVADLPIITILTQVDRLRPIREWQPPYNWEKGEKPPLSRPVKGTDLEPWDDRFYGLLQAVGYPTGDPDDDLLQGEDDLPPAARRYPAHTASLPPGGR